MSKKHSAVHKQYNYHQHLFIRYTFAILVDLTVLNLFNEYWEHVYIESFTVSLLAAILLQLLLQVTLKIEHKVAHYFKSQTGVRARIMRGISTWAILFISKLIILKAMVVLFGDSIVFSGALHGVFTFIAVVIAIIVTEQLIMKINRMLEY